MEWNEGNIWSWITGNKLESRYAHSFFIFHNFPEIKSYFSACNYWIALIQSHVYCVSIRLRLHTFLIYVSLISAGHWSSDYYPILSDWENMPGIRTALLLSCPSTVISPLHYETLRVSMVQCAVTPRWLPLPLWMQQSEHSTLTLWLALPFSVIDVVFFFTLMLYLNRHSCLIKTKLFLLYMQYMLCCHHS